MPVFLFRLAAMAALSGLAARAGAQSGGSADWVPQVLGTQATFIGQRLGPFDSPYSGPMSLVAGGDHSLSHTYGIYLGARITARLDGYLDVEMARGSGISHASGLAGVTNGDVLRQGTADLGNGPYVARAFLRFTVPMKSGTDTVPRGIDQLAEPVARRRLEIEAGKFAASDVFDVNRYANSTRTQFLNWGLFQNTAWDFAADTRGYTNGIALSWIAPFASLRVGSFQMPRQANGNVFDSDLRTARGDNAELTVNMLPGGGAVRILAYRNHARMGDYVVALARARATGTAPSIVDDDTPGRRKRGVGLNIEQPLADGGETGAFLRAGEEDGTTESFAFTEVEGHLSGGVQVAGQHWGRPLDRLGVAALRHTINQAHRDYLAAGGIGFLLGDGQLRYGPETFLESYYRIQAGPYLQISPDVQYVRNPGYNRDRGPAVVSSLRANVRY
jgi:Carbohydrate-selective porin